jgi:2'-5' RNA ligase
MANLVIVAIPTEDDYVNKISSQQVAHMTLLFLGEVSTVKNLDSILGFVQHAASQSLSRFGMEVDRRAELGQDQADTLVFSKSKWSGFDTINTFRSYLLKDNNIRTAYDSVEQHDEWIPHLTLGYPETPANPDNRDYPGITYVTFDRVAVWFTDFDGIEFPLKSPEWAMEMVMGNGKGIVEDILGGRLSHHGVKGQKWGVRRKATVGAQEVIVSDKRKKLKTSGGQGHPAHPDAVKSRTAGQIAKKSGTKALSNAELKAYNERLNLEQNFKRLQYQDSSAGSKFVKKLLMQKGGQGVEKGLSAGGTAAMNSAFVRKKMATGAAALALAL